MKLLLFTAFVLTLLIACQTGVDKSAKVDNAKTTISAEEQESEEEMSKSSTEIEEEDYIREYEEEEELEEEEEDVEIDSLFSN